MSTERLAKWSKESKEFFTKAEDKSIVLDLVISYSCASQTGEGFEELVNTINSEEIKRKVKKVIITDTSYLYRHTIPEFSKYSDLTIPTEWYLKNKEAIKKLTLSVELKSWARDIDTEKFKKWYKKIMQDYSDNGNRNDINYNYKKLVDENALDSYYKGNGSFEQCRAFILEENAHLSAILNNTIIAYPMSFYSSMKYLIKKYKLNITHLAYKLSGFSRKRNNVSNSKIQSVCISIIVIITILNK